MIWIQTNLYILDIFQSASLSQLKILVFGSSMHLEITQKLPGDSRQKNAATSS